MTIPTELEGILVSTPDTLHGAVRFAGTRVFAYQLFDYILSGRTLDQFLDDFEGVSREHAKAVLRWKLHEVHNELEPAVPA
jgi:uncharacterized protein (DUF433 family)